MEKNDNTPLVIVLIVVLVLALSGGHYVGYYEFDWLFGVVALIAIIWVIYDVLVNNKRLSEGMKVLWVVCAILFNIITAIIYYFVGRETKNNLSRNNGKRKI